MSEERDLSASIHQRLLNKAKADQIPFGELLQYFAIERFLYRLSKSVYRNSFILKGAMVFLAWNAPFGRPTRDIDFLGITDNSVENLIQIFQKVCQQQVDPDGLFFDHTSFFGEIIKEDAVHSGVRLKFLGYLDKSRINMQIDVGFADIVTPGSLNSEFPLLLKGFPMPSLQIYPPETVISEKFQIIVSLGKINSRLKDYYDLWFIANWTNFDFEKVEKAILNTFHQRNIDLPGEMPFGLVDEFAVMKQGQWKAFLTKNHLEDAPVELSEVLSILRNFFSPFIKNNNPSPVKWSAQMGWVYKSKK
jgi:hypothetical protein